MYDLRVRGTIKKFQDCIYVAPVEMCRSVLHFEGQWAVIIFGQVVTQNCLREI